MEFVHHSHLHGLTVVTKEFPDLWREIDDVLGGITDEDIIAKFESSKEKMSISSAINALIDERLAEKGWSPQSPIFSDDEFKERRWRLDFAKRDISVEVAFNHGEALAWNLLKPTLANKLNHVKKAIETQAGIIILATDAMKAAGAFDSAVGSYEKALTYLRAMNHILVTPVILIGLKPPRTFRIEKKRKENGRNRGIVVRLH